MFKFQTEQEIVNIAGVKVGGQPGELPTVLAGTIFYDKHEIVEDVAKGLFDRNAAEELINLQEASSEETGNPHIIHIFGTTPKSITRYIDFVTEISEAPFLIDSPEGAVRSHAAEYVSEIGLADRAIYNSINLSINASEIEALALSDIDSSIILGFNAMDSTLQGRMELLENGAGLLEEGLLSIADSCGIVNKLIDPSITPIGNGAGVALRMTITAKAKWGHPTGSGIHNAPSAWNWLNRKKEENPILYKICDIGSTCLQQAAAGDFILYGPIEYAPYVFPMAAMSDIMIAEAVADLDIEPVSRHPINLLV
ncbi:tetrahydromethanopterin S-methyltransferase subunit H [Methanosarcina sp. Z-7115]|uniref:Tetrahydromethanopterin S-methyltransferase subunit H n=1 Tax=Methanosarcina baikalica TaxID=3073890 RepID=A0ABU2CZT8_9EURY|nr:tetrahydromethanopterin S-methyltransferase subunit H [Methanosarcina sp. Z-7115]MDR7665255.1 tetrahydromethanopterin S-methyltransferase subunit H [Methanosarcina sp. Z-7115]